jgi:hypothetical protein
LGVARTDEPEFDGAAGQRAKLSTGA